MKLQNLILGGLFLLPVQNHLFIEKLEVNQMLVYHLEGKNERGFLHYSLERIFEDKNKNGAYEKDEEIWRVKPKDEI